MVIELENWTIEAREGYAVGGDLLDFVDENDAPVNLQNCSAKMKILGFGSNLEFTSGNGCFVLLPPVAPQNYPTQWEFKLTVQQVASLKNGDNDFEVLISDQFNVLIGQIDGVIKKRK